VRVLAAALFFAFSLAALADAVTDRARDLLARKDATAAYELLLPLEPQRAGDPEFDYLLGIASLDAGDRERAIFALERVLAVQPGNLQARAEIARAYYELGEKDTAQREFESVRGGDLPPQVRTAVDRYLSAIATSRTTRFNAYLEIAAGHDSNVNAATAQSQVAVPFFGGALFQLAPGALELEDSFAALNAGLSFGHDLSAQWSLVGGASYYGKYNRDITLFDMASWDAALGLRWAKDANAITLVAQGQTYSVDDRRYRDSLGGTLQWQHNLSQASQVSLFLQHAALSYPDPTQEIRDAHRTIAGAGVAHAFGGEYAPVVFASVYGGEEREDNETVPHLGHKPLGLRLGAQTAVAVQTILFGTLAFEQRKYNGDDPLFLTRRDDRQIDATIGVNYTFAPKWSLRPQATYTENSSNIEIYSYKRTVAQIGLRRDF
jgi:tetratricopeptide (TPR) repeat protein